MQYKNITSSAQQLGASLQGADQDLPHWMRTVMGFWASLEPCLTISHSIAAPKTT